MHIHFAVTQLEMPQYKDFVKQLKDLGHRITYGKTHYPEADMVVCTSDTVTVAPSILAKLEDSVKKASKKVADYSTKSKARTVGLK